MGKGRKEGRKPPRGGGGVWGKVKTSTATRGGAWLCGLVGRLNLGAVEEVFLRGIRRGEAGGVFPRDRLLWPCGRSHCLLESTSTCNWADEGGNSLVDVANGERKGLHARR